MRQWIVGAVTAGMIATLAGCTTGNGTAQHSSQRLPAGVVEALPQNIASPPINLRISPMDRPPVLQAVYDGKSRVNVAVRSRWRGQTVTLYYLPRYNLRHEGTHYKLLAANKVQKIGQYPIDRNGHWNADWDVGNYRVPPHVPLYLLAITDAGQIGIVHTDTL